MSMGEVVRYAVDVLLLRAGETPISGGEGWGGEGRGGEERGGCWLEYVRRKCGVTVPRLLYALCARGSSGASLMAARRRPCVALRSLC